MLAAFILGLAFGGLWMRKRMRSAADPVRYVGLCAGAAWAARALAVAARSSPRASTSIGWMMRALSRTESGYVLFNVGSQR